MMISASWSLTIEGVRGEEITLALLIPVFAGMLLGVGFVLVTSGVLEQYEDIKFSLLDGGDARKVLLFVVVMTVHSLTEGVSDVCVIHPYT